MPNRALHNFFYLLLFLSGSTVYAQQKNRIYGCVNDKITNEALPGVLVQLNDSVAAQSNLDGKFYISVPAEASVLKISLLGYQEIVYSLPTNRPDSIFVNITMEAVNQVLEEVVVSAGRFEQKLSDVVVSMEVIKPALLENKAVAAVDQIMNQVPGVNISDSQVSIRGGSGFSYGAGSRVLMLVDELPMISADAADIKWNYLPIENLEQIEVIKGASSALFGSSALNGVINLRTAYAKDKPITTVTSMYGVYGQPDRESLAWWKGKKNPEYRSTSFSHLQKIGQLDLVLAGNVYDNDGFRMLETETRGRGNINLRYRFKKLPGLQTGINVNYMNVKGGAFFLWQNDSLAYIPRDSSVQQYDNIRYNIDPFVVYHSEKTGRHSLRTRLFSTNNRNDKNQESKARLYYSEYQWQKRFSDKFTFTTGWVSMKQGIFSDSLYGRHNGHNTSVYVQGDGKAGKLTLSMGLRFEYYRVDTVQTKARLFSKELRIPIQPVARAGLNYQLKEYTFLRASFGQGYRFPSVAEKYIRTYVGSLNIFPNPALRPEYGWSSELGIKQGFRIKNFRAFADAAFFWTEYKNMMDFVFMYDTIGKSQQVVTLSDLMLFAGFQSQNIGRARIRGIDLSVNGTGKIGKTNITLLCGYTYTHPINPAYKPAIDTTGTLKSNLLKYRSKHLFKNDIQLDFGKISFGFSSRFNSFMANIDKRFEEPLIYENLNPNFPVFYNLPGWYILPGLKKFRQKHNRGDWMHDVRIAWQISKALKASFLINNLFNHEYMSRPGFIEAPRTFIIQFGFKF